MKKFLCLTIVFIILSSPVLASVSLGVSPGLLNYKKVLKGGFARRSMTISTSLEQEVLTVFKLEGNISDWISLSPNDTEIYISKSKPYKVGVDIKPPETAENGNYTGIIHIRTEKLGYLGGAKYGSIIKADITVKVNVEVVGDQILSCFIGGVEVKDSEVGYPIDVYVQLYNDGNVQLSPLFEYSVWDQMQENLVQSNSQKASAVLPTITKKVYMGIDNQLNPGQYWLTLKVPECGFSTTRTFDIVEAGKIADKGELRAVNTKPWVTTGELVPIVGIFKNTGSRPEDVKLRFEIKKNNEIVSVLESETLKVLEGKSQNFQQYFLAKAPGRYEVNAVAYYNKKVSFEKGTIINVRPPLKKSPNYLLYSVYIIMIIIIVWLAKRIYNEKH